MPQEPITTPCDRRRKLEASYQRLIDLTCSISTIILPNHHLGSGEVKDAIDVVAAWDNEPRGHGQYAQTKAFAIVFPSGDPSIFGIGEVWAEIAV